MRRCHTDAVTCIDCNETFSITAARTHTVCPPPRPKVVRTAVPCTSELPFVSTSTLTKTSPPAKPKASKELTSNSSTKHNNKHGKKIEKTAELLLAKIQTKKKPLYSYYKTVRSTKTHRDLVNLCKTLAVQRRGDEIIISLK